MLFYLVLYVNVLKILSVLSYVLKRVFNDGETDIFNYIYCARPVTGRHHAIESKNEYTHNVKAGLCLRWAHMVFLYWCIHVTFL